MNTELGAHRRIETYLDDLARMLAGADPVLRAEVLGGVREHVETALGDRTQGATEADVVAVLTELGPPEAVAAAAMEGEGGGARAAGASPQDGHLPVSSPPALGRGWVPPTVGLLLLVALGLYLLAVAGMSFFFAVTEVTTEAGGSAQPTSGGFHAPQTEDFAAGHAPLLPAAYDVAWSAVAPLFLAGLPWLVATTLLAASPLWTGREKWAGGLLLPGAAVLNAAGLAAALSLAGTHQGAATTVLVLGLVATAGATVLIVTRLWRSGSRRARAVAVGGSAAGPGPAVAAPRRNGVLITVLVLVGVLILLPIVLPLLLAAARVAV